MPSQSLPSRKAADGQRLALRAGFLGPVSAAAGRIAAVAHLGDDTFQSDLAGVFEHLLTVDFKTFTELEVGAINGLFEERLAPSTILRDFPFSSFCRTEKSVVPLSEGTTTSPSTIALPAAMCQASSAIFRKRFVQSLPRRVKTFTASLTR